MINNNPLIDVKKSTGEVVDWDGKKQRSMLLADSFLRLNMEKQYETVAGCGSYLEFKRFLSDGTFKLSSANFCKNKLCPLCNWRRSLKIFSQVSTIMDALQAEKQYKFLFMTVSQKNCKADNLASEIHKMNKAFHDLQYNGEYFKPCIKGYFKALEVTYNKKSDTYHPHFHVLVAVDMSYGKKGGNYISQETLCNLWERYMELDYTPVCDIRLVKAKEGKTIGGIVAEVAKYAVKDSDYLFENLSSTDMVVYTLFTSLSSRRMVSFGGKFKELHKKLNLDNTDDDLVHNGNDTEIRDDLGYIIEVYNWNIGFSQYRMISSERCAKIDIKGEDIDT